MRNMKLYLSDIVDAMDAMDAIERFVEDMDYEAFRVDDKTISAVIRKFEIIGEASKSISKEIKDAYPAIPWKELAGFRDKLIYFHFGIKYELVWHSIKDVIPEIKPMFQEILRDE